MNNKTEKEMLLLYLEDDKFKLTKDDLINIKENINIENFFDEYLKEKTTNKIQRNILNKLILLNFSTLQETNPDNFIEPFLEKSKSFINDHNKKEQYKQLMTSNKIRLENFVKEKDFKEKKNETSLEKQERIDNQYSEYSTKIENLILKNKVKKIKKELSSTKNSYLFNEETDVLIEKLLKIGFTSKDFQDNIGKKIASFQDPLLLSGALMNLLEYSEQWNANLFFDKIEKSGLKNIEDYEILSNEDNKLIIEARTFKATSTLGSKMWCLSRNEKNYHDYKEYQMNNYTFIYDFDKDPLDPLSMIAALSDNENNVKEAYQKTDEQLLPGSQEKEDVQLLLKNKGLKKDDLTLDRIKAKFKDYKKRPLFIVKYLSNDQFVNLIENSSDYINPSDETFSTAIETLVEKDNYNAIASFTNYKESRKNPSIIIDQLSNDQYYNVIKLKSKDQVITGEFKDEFEDLINVLLKKKNYKTINEIISNESVIELLNKEDDKLNYFKKNSAQTIFKLIGDKGFNDYLKQNPDFKKNFEHMPCVSDKVHNILYHGFDKDTGFLFSDFSSISSKNETLNKFFIKSIKENDNLINYESPKFNEIIRISLKDKNYELLENVLSKKCYLEINKPSGSFLSKNEDLFLGDDGFKEYLSNKRPNLLKRIEDKKLITHRVELIKKEMSISKDDKQNKTKKTNLTKTFFDFIKEDAGQKNQSEFFVNKMTQICDLLKKKNFIFDLNEFTELKKNDNVKISETPYFKTLKDSIKTNQIINKKVTIKDKFKKHFNSCDNIFDNIKNKVQEELNEYKNKEKPLFEENEIKNEKRFNKQFK